MLGIHQLIKQTPTLALVELRSCRERQKIIKIKKSLTQCIRGLQAMEKYKAGRRAREGWGCNYSTMAKKTSLKSKDLKEVKKFAPWMSGRKAFPGEYIAKVQKQDRIGGLETHRKPSVLGDNEQERQE